jgi:hypothetical protein
LICIEVEFFKKTKTKEGISVLVNLFLLVSSHQQTSLSYLLHHFISRSSNYPTD